MKATVIRAFFDAQDPSRKLYQIGSEFEGTQNRVKELAGKGFVEPIEEPKKKTSRKKG